MRGRLGIVWKFEADGEGFVEGGFAFFGCVGRGILRFVVAWRRGGGVIGEGVERWYEQAYCEEEVFHYFSIVEGGMALSMVKGNVSGAIFLGRLERSLTLLQLGWASHAVKTFAG